MEAFPSGGRRDPALDTKMDVDVGKPAVPHGLAISQDAGSIPTLEGWIETLMSCKQLSENDVSRLCDRVGIPQNHNRHKLTGWRRQEKYSRKSRMYNLWYVSKFFELTQAHKPFRNAL